MSNELAYQPEVLLDQILAKEDLTAVFQPVVSLCRQDIFAYEGLIRGPAGSPLAKPDALFGAAFEYGRLGELDRICRKLVINRFAELNLPGHLFINVNPLSLSDGDAFNGATRDYLRQRNIDPARVVIEITETHPIENTSLFQQALEHYRHLGFKVALDDLGAGYSGLKLWSEVNPDFVKIDRHFIQNVDQDQTKRRFVQSILDIAKSLGSETITEGIETKNEYSTLRKMGINLVQGFYFARPEHVPQTKLNSQLFSKREQRISQGPRITAARLLTPCETVSPDTTVEQVAEIFRENNELRTIPVLDRDDAPIGLVLRNDLMNMLTSRFGRELFGRKPIRGFVHQRYIRVDMQTPLEDVSRQVTDVVNHYTEEFIITDNGAFAGKGTLMDLLRGITEMQVAIARYSNPLTLLPGNVIVQQTLTSTLDTQEDFVVAYCDLDHFKAFNDAYGYGLGDEVIRLLGRLLQESVDADRDFVGHIGGDDFIVIYQTPDWLARCRQLLRTFQQLIPEYYSPQDARQGGIITADRFGVQRKFPIMTLSIGAVEFKTPHRDLTCERIAELTSATKAKAKQSHGNRICADQYDESGPEPGWPMAAGLEFSGVQA